jgi:hypothetical protein
MSKIAPKYRRFLNIDIDPLSIAWCVICMMPVGLVMW